MDKETWEDIVTHGAYSSELDWFAVDDIGQIGIFSAVLNAPIHEVVKRSYEKYSRLFDIISNLPPTTEAVLLTSTDGNLSDWLEYSTKGLYAFDFQDVHRNEKLDKYDIISKPEKPLTIQDMNLDADLLDAIPKLSTVFGDNDIENEKITAYNNR